MKLSSLNVKSHYSLLDSLLSVQDIITCAKSQGRHYVCLIDDNVLYGAIEFYNLAHAYNLKPIIGIEILTHENNQFVVIPFNKQGWIDLMHLSSLKMCNETVDNALLFSKLNWYLIQTDHTLIKSNHPYFYYAENENTKNLINVIALSTARVLNEEDQPFLKVLNAIKNEAKLDKATLKVCSDKNLSILEDSQIRERYSPIACDNLAKLIDNVNWQIETNDKNIFNFAEKFTNENAYQLLREKCIAGAKKKHVDLENLEYFNRLNYELEVIEAKGFANYFLIVQDFINFAKHNNIIVGPGRGSAAGSLVSYVLDITNIDPIKYHLFFERFLNPDRQSMPDIDTDIMDSRRDEVIDYIFQKYGNNHVAHIITFSTIKAKMAIRDVGRVLSIDNKIVDKIAKEIKPEFDFNIRGAIQSSTYLQDMHLKFPELFNAANKIIGVPRQVSTHAAGVVISNTDIRNLAPIQTGINNHAMVQFSMNYLEELGLIKMDLLGLKNLTIINWIIKLINYRHQININLENINLEESAVFEMLAAGETTGVFQLESPGMRKMIKRINPKNIEDISITSAIFRPGASAHANTFIENKQKNKHTNYKNEDIKNILDPTYGVIVYQEQIIRLVQAVAKFDAGKSDLFRRAISKKDDQKIMSLKDEFIDAARKNDYSQKEAEDFFSFMLEFANYGFNHSHSLAYSLISYQLAWLKFHYPIETLCILLSLGDSTAEKLALYVEEAKFFNIILKLPDLNISNTNFVINNNEIYFSFSSIFGIGLEKAKKIVYLREQEPNKVFTDPWIAIVKLVNNGINTKLIESLIKVGAFDSFQIQREFLLANLEQISDPKKNVIVEGKFMFDPKFHEPEPLKNKQQQYAIWEEEYLNVSLSGSTKPELNDGQIIECEILSVKKVVTKSNKNMFRLKINYLNTQFNVTTFDIIFIDSIENRLPLKIRATVKLYDKMITLRKLIEV